jgi:hypothetical protein
MHIASSRLSFLHVNFMYICISEHHVHQLPSSTSLSISHREYQNRYQYSERLLPSLRSTLRRFSRQPFELHGPWPLAQHVVPLHLELSHDTRRPTLDDSPPAPSVLRCRESSCYMSTRIPSLIRIATCRAPIRPHRAIYSPFYCRVGGMRYK